MVKFPNSFSCGEILSLCVTDNDYESVKAYVVGPQRHEITFSLVDGEWKATADTSEWIAGLYAFELWAVSSSSSRTILERGQLTAKPSLFSSGVDQLDPRSKAQKMVEMIEQMMAGNAAAGVRRYRINNRELERYSLAELLQMLGHWKRQAQIENRKACGLPVLGPSIAFHF